jgi:hypothetical protein
MKSLVAVALIACSSKSAPIARDAATTSIDAFANDVEGSIFDENNLPVGSAMVCVLHHDEIPCQVTASNGTYVMALPELAGDDIAIQVTADGFLGEVLLDEEPAQGVSWPTEIPLEMMPDAIVDLATDAGFTYPGTGGFLEVRVMGGTSGVLTGATATIAPDSGEGPVYRGSDGTPTPSLIGTSSDGGVIFGNVAAGVYEVTANAGSAACTVAPGGALLVGDWPADVAGATTRVEVADGSITNNVNIICD